MSATIITNNVPRLIIDDYELSADERAEFDYLPWDKIEAGEEQASFVRYKGQLYDVAEFMAWAGESWAPGWAGYHADSFFSGILIRFIEHDQDRVIMGRYFA